MEKSLEGFFYEGNKEMGWIVTEGWGSKQHFLKRWISDILAWRVEMVRLLLFSYSVTFHSLQPMDCSTPGFHYWTGTHLSFTISRSLLKLMSVESVIPSNHLILLLMTSIFPSIRVFSNELALHIRWPKYWSFSFSICPSSEYSESISLRMDW